MQSILKSGLTEIIKALKSHEQWLYLGVQDIKLRYRRSIIGPWWVTISTGIMIMMLSFLWSKIFGSDIKTYMPFFAIGFIVWNWMSSIVTESAEGFFPFQAVIKQIKLPFPVFILRLCMRLLIVLAHNLVVIFLVLFIIGNGLSWLNLLSIPAFILIQLNLVCLSVIIAIFCTRFQDMSQVVSTFTQIIFFFTPILWQPETIKGKSYLVEFNPVHHWIEIIRAPLLGNMPSINNWLWSLGTLMLLLIISIYTMGRYRSRIAFWL
jgi:ABC-type polysaccharide/polyol phosphate export permease